MSACAPFRFVLVLPARPGAEEVAFLRVSGVPLVARLLAGARRAGAVELWVRGPRPSVERVRARLGWADLRAGEPPLDGLPVVEAPAEVELSRAAFELLARARGPVFVPRAPAVAKDARLGPARPLWEGEAPPGVHALPVTNADEARVAKRRIFRELASPSASPVARRLNAPLSKALSWFLVETPVTPAMATAAHALVGVLSAFFFAVGDLGALLVAGALFELASVLDGVDGELARAKLLDSPRGAWIDTAGDTVAYVAFAAALPVGYARHAASTGAAWASLVPALGLVLVSASVALVASMAAYAARSGLGGSMSGVADAVASALGSRSRRLRACFELGRRALFSKVVAVACALAAATGRGAFYDALFFGTLAVVLSMSGVLVAAASRRGRAAARGARRLTSPRAGA